MNVSTVVKKEYKSKGAKVVTMAQFINDYKYEDIYLTSTIPKEMLNEFNVRYQNKSISFSFAINHISHMSIYYFEHEQS